jgi:hypothetical protein
MFCEKCKIHKNSGRYIDNHNNGGYNMLTELNQGNKKPSPHPDLRFAGVWTIFCWLTLT